MTDPERISRRGAGLAAQLLRSSAEEEPNDVGLERTLAALGVSGAVLSTTSAAGAVGAAASAKLTSAVSAGAGKAVTGALLLKWVGVGVVSGVGLAGAAALVTAPTQPPPPAVSAPSRRVVTPVVSATPRAVRPTASPLVSAEAPVEPAVPPRAVPSVREPVTPPTAEASAPLAAEVAYVDRARAQLAAGSAEAGLDALARYEREFPEARLLPEVLFLQLETYQRLGRTAEARRAAERLVSAFPKSPHATRARAVLGAHFP